MSIFQVQATGIREIRGVISGSSATAILTADQNLYVPWLEISEHAGSTASLTVEIYDGSTSTYLGAGGSTWNAVPVTAKQSIVFDQGYVLPEGSSIRITSSDAAGKFHYHGTVMQPY